ncbi:MAG: fused MFS/spermidine synthase [Pseudomonadales bacterium]|nr:fused MFS/spermidine synthase [Pseudomonadales bacterium]
MAVIYSKQVKGVRYEVRTAGASRRLYTNGAFHTQYNPKHLFTGAVWDLLCLPVLCRERAPASILVLGVAGGTVIHQLQALCNSPKTTGIELDKVHIELASSHFDLDYPNLTLVHADARDWLATSKQKFDCIIDDIFVHGESDPERPVNLDRRWFRQLKSQLNKDGLLIQNHIDHESAKQAAGFMKQGSLLGLQTDKYENLVLAWFRSGPGGKRLQSNLESRLTAMPRAVTSRLRSDVFRFSA